jgi:DNA-binding transcriptional regulator GbsR (MarR family)
MTTQNKQIVSYIGHVNRTVLFFKTNKSKRYGFNQLVKDLSISKNEMRNIIKFLLLNNIILMKHKSNSTKKYYYKKLLDIEDLINKATLLEQLRCLGMTVLILKELQDCNTKELNDCIKDSEESIVQNIEKLQKQIKK